MSETDHYVVTSPSAYRINPSDRKRLALFDEDGRCLMIVSVDHPVVNGDTIQFPPITISI